MQNKNIFLNILKAVPKEAPLIHYITHPISINQCANIILALSSRPIMAEHPDETYEITSTASVLAVNFGNITKARYEAIINSAKAAFEKDIPVIVDMVGIGCSHIRRELLNEILKLKNKTPVIFKGNASEIRMFFSMINDGKNENTVSGVDAAKEDIFDRENIKNILPDIKKISKKINAIFYITGKYDFVISDTKCFVIENGNFMMGNITGTGCMATAVCAAYLSRYDDFDEDIKSFCTNCCVLAASVWGIAGEMAFEDDIPPMKFQERLIDSLWDLQRKDIEKYMRVGDLE